MNFKLNIEPNETYYQEAYEEILSSKKLKKWEPVLAILLLLFGVILFFLDKNRTLGLFPLLFIGFGIFEFISFFYKKKKWIKARLNNPIVDHPVGLKLEFDDLLIKHSGPFSTGEMKWDGIKEIIKTRKGIILRPENGIFIYLPDDQFKNKEEIEFILSKKVTL